MTDPKLNLNPFVLPGMGQTGEASSNPLFASMEMLRQAMSGLSQVGGAMGVPASLSPTLNPEELERRIQELKVVENWLKLNLSMLSSTIQGMEVQLATISTIRAFVGADGVLKTEAPPKAEYPPKPDPSPEPPAQAMPAAAKAWWDMLETQFKQVAAATAATLVPKKDANSSQKGKQSAKQPVSETGTKTARKSSVRGASRRKGVSPTPGSDGSDNE